MVTPKGLHNAYNALCSAEAELEGVTAPEGLEDVYGAAKADVTGARHAVGGLLERAWVDGRKGAA